MGSVQSEIACKKCNYPCAMEDYYYKSGEGFVFCPCCGYSLSAFMVHDPRSGRKKQREAEELIKQGKIDEALEVSGNMGWVSTKMVDGKEIKIPISEWGDERKINAIRETWWDSFHKKDKDGSIVWEVKETGGYGAYLHRNKRGRGSGGHFLTKWDAKRAIRQMIRELRKSSRARDTITYTKKICGKWYQFDARTGKKTLMDGEANAD